MGGGTVALQHGRLGGNDVDTTIRELLSSVLSSLVPNQIILTGFRSNNT